ncbi:hypothetical protein GY45DRAFT_1341053 [Cubamyces sp. BRFM 1775]|nr:hypothetical protein GY45DRAFT_1341053 [Cubamyces sp. BRFM 1775]
MRQESAIHHFDTPVTRSMREIGQTAVRREEGSLGWSVPPRPDDQMIHGSKYNHVELIDEGWQGSTRENGRLVATHKEETPLTHPSDDCKLHMVYYDRAFERSSLMQSPFPPPPANDLVQGSTCLHARYLASAAQEPTPNLDFLRLPSSEVASHHQCRPRPAPARLVTRARQAALHVLKLPLPQPNAVAGDSQQQGPRVRDSTYYRAAPDLFTNTVQLDARQTMPAMRGGCTLLIPATEHQCRGTTTNAGGYITQMTTLQSYTPPESNFTAPPLDGFPQHDFPGPEYLITGVQDDRRRAIEREPLNTIIHIKLDGLRNPPVGQVLLLTNQWVWSSTYITFYVYPRETPLPSFLCMLTGFSDDDNKDITSMVWHLFNSEPIQPLLLHLTRMDPGFDHLSQEEAENVILSSLYAQIDILKNGNVHVAVFPPPMESLARHGCHSTSHPTASAGIQPRT